MLPSFLGRLACGLLAILMVGCAKPPQQFVEVTVNCPRATTLLLESGLALPLEIELAGMPGLQVVSCVIQPGQVFLYLEFQARPGTDQAPDVLQRFAAHQNHCLPFDAPTFREIVKLPALSDGPMTTGLDVKLHYQVLQQLGIDAGTVWKAIYEQCDPTGDLDAQERQLAACKILHADREISLSDIALIERVEHPEPLARESGFRLARLQALRRKP